MGCQFDVIFIDSFMDDVTYVRDVEVCGDLSVVISCNIRPLSFINRNSFVFQFKFTIFRTVFSLLTSIFTSSKSSTS